MIIGNQKILWRWISKLFHPPEESPDYRAWKQKLFRDRLIFCFWLILICVIIFGIKDFIEVYLPANSQRLIEHSGRERLELYRARTIYSYLAIITIWLICWYRWQKDRFRHHTRNVFLAIAWSQTVCSQIVGTLIGEPYLKDVYHWGIFFLALAILIPVRWRIHFIAQLGLIIYYLGIMPMLGKLGLIEVDLAFIFDPDTLAPFLIACPVSIVSIAMYERLQQQEFESRQELKVFLHSVTHDLKTPVMASSIVLKKILQQPGEQITLDRSVLERLYQGSDRTFKIVDSLIEAHSTEVNGIRLIPQVCRIQDLVNSVLIDLQPVFIEHQAIVNNHLNDNLPSLWADPTQLWRVLNNLISNALKHNPNSVQITIDATVENDYLYLTIHDDGVGIAAERSDRLFQLYTRGKRSRYMPGLGIGLYLSQQIVTAHGGEIGVISSLGDGSTFWFTLPCQSRSI